MDLETVRIQNLTGRTPKGWPIETKVKALVEKSLNMSEEYIDHIGECKNCGLVLNQEFFYAGCPNCNAKDIRMLT